jgi:hypothetical protein
MAVTSIEDLRRASGQRVDVEGRYRQIDVRMRIKGDPVYHGHVAVMLDDGTEVTLEPVWAEDAIRPPEEIARCDGHRVRVTGTAHEQAPEAPEPTASLISPCISPVEAVEAVDLP